MDGFVCIGRIVEPQGLKGLLKVHCFFSDSSSLERYSPLLTDRSELLTLRVQESRKNDVFIVSVNGYHDRTSVEPLCHQKLWFHRSLLPTPDEDEYYFDDLVGLSVFDASGADYGKISGVYNYGAGYFLDIKKDTQLYTLPFNKDSVIKVDIHNTKSVVINPDFLLS